MDYYNALATWSAVAGTIATFAAVVVALFQTVIGQRQIREQLAHQNWLERRRIEEAQLMRMLEAMRQPADIAETFYFSMLRLLASIQARGQASLELEQELRSLVNETAARTTQASSVAGGYVDVIAALRELHSSRRESELAKLYDDLLREMSAAQEAASDLHEMLSDMNAIAALDPASFVELPARQKARDAANSASRTIARRIVRLYEESARPVAYLGEAKK